MEKTEDIAVLMRENQNVSLKDKLAIVLHLSTPAILAQISEIAIQYIDAAMVGSLGASASAAIGLVSSSTWLLGGSSVHVRQVSLFRWPTVSGQGMKKVQSPFFVSLC